MGGPTSKNYTWCGGTEVVDPRTLGAKCAGCPFAKGGKPNRPVLGEGPANPVGVLVGEGPGREDADRGRPFVGATGNQLDISLSAAGLVRPHLLVINATCCVPPMHSTEPQKAKAVAHCRPALLAQLQHLPKNIPILAMGKYAFSALTGRDKGVFAARGFIRWEFEIPAPQTEDDDAGDTEPVRDGEVDSDRAR